jgi:hypothetical protein
MCAQAKRASRRMPTVAKSGQIGLDRVCWERCSKNRRIFEVFRTTQVSLKIPPHCSHRYQVEQIAAVASQRIESVANELFGSGSPRGSTLFHDAATCIDRIVASYPEMRWWISDSGLNIARIGFESRLSQFDAAAGQLLEGLWRDDRLSQESLLMIARSLDERKLSLKENLQPGPWAEIASHNTANPKRAIKTFGQAVTNPRFARGVRRRLYVARNNFKSQQHESE